jgi:hypothetical protein
MWLLIAVGMAISAAFAQDTVFGDVQLPGAKGTLTNATLRFADDEKVVVVHSADGNSLQIPYDRVDKLSYEYTQQHRIKQGVALAALSTWTAGAGVVVAFTKSKSHWLEIDYMDQNVPTSLVLRLDKSDYQAVCDVAKARTGKDLTNVGRMDLKSLNDKTSTRVDDSKTRR